MARAPRFHDELNELQDRLPRWGGRALGRAEKPAAIWIRIPAGLVLMVGGVLGFLPILGFWMLPLGLALIAIDLPFLHAPLARLLAWVNRKLAAVEE